MVRLPPSLPFFMGHGESICITIRSNITSLALSHKSYTVIHNGRIHSRNALGSALQGSQDEISSHVQKSLRHERGERLLHEAVNSMEYIVQVGKIQAVVKLLSQLFNLEVTILRICMGLIRASFYVIVMSAAYQQKRSAHNKFHSYLCLFFGSTPDKTLQEANNNSWYHCTCRKLNNNNNNK